MRKEKMEEYSCFVGNEKYFFTYPLPNYRNGKYYGVATFWKEGTDDRDTVPYWTKEDQIDLAHQKIAEGIEKKLESKNANRTDCGKR